MDLNSLFDAGGVQIPNPEWSESKKNKVPRFITVTDIDRAIPQSSGMADVAYRAAATGNQDILGTKEELDKYRKYGITPNDFEDIYGQLVKKQGAFKKFGNAIAQALVSEVVLGTLKGVSDLVDIIGRITGLSDGDYTNPVSAYLEEKQEEFRNFAPIYADPNKTIANGGLTDAGWWASNLPSVMSSLTLLIPSSGAVKGASAIGKLGKVGARTRNAMRVITGANKRIEEAQRLRKAGASVAEVQNAMKLNKVQRFLTSRSTGKQTALFLENGMTATLSRAMENYQEARQTYNDMYEEATDVLNNMSDEEYENFLTQNKDILLKRGPNLSNRQEVAKAIAEESADRTFKDDWLNIGFDIIEMYGLRNAWKGFKNAHGTPSKVRRANIDAAKYADKTPEQIKVIKAGRSFKEKASEWAGDRLYSSKFIIGAQLSEGVEEAINYISTQDGMHLGRVMMGTEEGKLRGFWSNLGHGFDNRLSQYIKDPEIWDSAFWGVMGGIVFQGLGSKFQLISNRIKEGKSDANAKNAEKNLPWYSFGMLPENKRRITEIESRARKLEEYKNKVAQIKSGIDIYNSTDAQQITFGNNSAAQQAALERAKTEFITDLTLTAMNSGNYDLLREYLQDENLRKAFVEMGIFDSAEDANKSQQEKEADAKMFIDNAVRQMDRIAEMYDEEIVAIDHASSQIASDTKKKGSGFETMLAEYMQIMATNNVRTRLELENRERELAAINTRIGEVVALNQDKLDPSINYENAVKLATLTQQLGYLRAQRKAIIKEQGNSLSAQIAVKNIDKQIASLEKNLSDAELIWATERSLRFFYNDQNKIEIGDTKDYFDYHDAMITKRLEGTPGNRRVFTNEYLNQLSERSRTLLEDSSYGEFETLAQDNETALGSIKTISKELDNLYQEKALTAQLIDNLKNDITRTTDEVKEYGEILHNTMDEARQNAIDESNKTLRRLYDKYGQTIRDIVADIYGNKNIEYNPNSGLSEAEHKQLLEALEVLDITKAYNQALVLELERQFDLMDMINAAKEVSPSSEESKENSTSQNGISAQQSSQQGSSSSAMTNNNTGQQSSQNEPIDPQNISNRQPSFYTKFYPKNGKLESGRHSNSPIENGAAIYDNEDGTFTIDPRGNLSMINDTRFFGNKDSVDIMRPYEISSYPIARRNAKGNLEIIQTGELVNTDTLEYQEQQAAQQAEEQAQQGQQSQGQAPAANPAPATAPQVSQQGQTQGQTNGTQPPISSTGEGNNGGQSSSTSQQAAQPAPAPAAQPSPSSTNPIIDYAVDQSQNIGFQAQMVTIQRLQEAIQANPNITFEELDAIAKEIEDEYVRQNYARDKIQPSINKGKEAWKRRLTRMRNNEPQTLKSSIDEVVTEQIDPLALGYKQAVEDMLLAYAKEFGIEPVDGKYYVNLEDLLRYINQLKSDKNLAEWMFDSLKSYLVTTEAKARFVITDETEANNKEEFLNNVEKTSTQRYMERSNEHRSQRVDITTLFKQLGTEEEKKRFEEALSELKEGDKLTYTIKQGVITVKDSKGRAVGTMPIPRINGSTGAFEMFNDGWFYSVELDSSGVVNSPLKNTFMRWFDPKNPAAVELNAIIYEMAYSKPTDERKAELFKKFNDNPEIRQAREQKLIAKNATTEELLEGLAKLWRYRDYITDTKLKKQNERVRASINNWFGRLYNSYVDVMDLAKNPGQDIVVDKIADGAIIKASNDKNGTDDYLPANQAIAGGVNPKIHKIANSGRNANGVIYPSGMPAIGFRGVQSNNTFVLIPNRNGSYEYVKTVPAEVTDSYIGEQAKEIIQAVQDHAIELYEAYEQDASDENYERLKEFLIGAFSNSGSNSSFFWNITAYETVVNGNKMLIIENRNVGRKISLVNGLVQLRITNPEYEANAQGRNEKTMRASTEEAKRNIRELINTLRFNITPNYIASDNASAYSLNGIAKKRNGKFEVKVGEKTWTFDSFNDFILSNNLVRLNTKPNEDGTSNFTRKGITTQKGNQVFRIRRASEVTSPVEKKQAETPTPSQPATNPINERLAKIISPDYKSDNKGLDIAKLIFGEKELKAFENLGLLPKNIIFDENFNKTEGQEEYGAYFDPKTGNIAVGTKWVELFNNPSSRKRAIRILIHEQLHSKLEEARKNGKDYVKSIEEIYNEFEKSLTDKNVPEDAHIREYLFKHERSHELALEEFLVESLTNKELADYLNSVDADVTKKGGRRNLFQKILEFMADLFGWGVREGSLYQKELYTIRDAFSKPINKETSIENTVETQVETNPAQPVTEVATPQQESTTPIQEENEDLQERKEDFSDDLIDEYEFSSVSEQTSEMDYTPEMNSIKEQAIADGTFMKAPNGNPTNLNERQWLQVRTKNFIDWFGDWINDPKNSSKVVDENGEPLVVYHGAKSVFTVFDASKSDNRQYISEKINPTNFFSDDKSVADFFAISEKQSLAAAINRSISIVLDAYSGADMSNEELAKDIDKDIWSEAAERTGKSAEYCKRFWENEVPEEYKMYDEWGTSRMKDENIEDYKHSVFLNMKNPIIIDAKGERADKVIENNKDILNNNDEVIIKNINETVGEKQTATDYLVRKSNNIKSATDNIGTFDNNNPDIRYSSVEEGTTRQFDNSLYRGVSSNFYINNETKDLILEPTYDSLFKSYGISFADNYSMAYGYGKRYSRNPYMIEIDKDYLETIVPFDENGGTQSYGKRVIGDEGEERIISKEPITIPKDYYKLRRNIPDYSNIRTDELLQTYIDEFDLNTSSDNIPFSRIEGMSSDEEIKEIWNELVDRFETEEDLKKYIANKYFTEPYSMRWGFEDPKFGYKPKDLENYKPKLSEYGKAQAGIPVDVRYSSTIEMASEIPTIQALQDRLPIDQQAKFSRLIERGAISTSCR